MFDDDTNDASTTTRCCADAAKAANTCAAIDRVADSLPLRGALADTRNAPSMLALSLRKATPVRMSIANLAGVQLEIESFWI